MRDHDKDSGAALLLALGVMALLLAMAMSFVTNAVIARNAAANNSSRSQARYFAKSAANRLLTDLMLTLQENKAVDGGMSLDVLPRLVSRYSGEEERSQDTGNDFGLDDKLKVDGYSDEEPHAPPQWVYVHEKTDDDGSPDTNSKIIGRYAYMALPAGAISLSEALRGAKSAATPSKYQRNWGKRYGVDMKEFDLRKVKDVKDLDATDVLTEAAQLFENEHRYPDHAPERLKNDYSDYDLFFSEYSIGDEARKVIRRYFAMGGRTEPEFYPHGSWNGAEKRFEDDTVYYHRFNLARQDWNGFGIEGGENSEDAVEQLLGYNNKDFPKFEQNKANSGENGRALQFLRMIGDDKAAYENLETRRKQIAANLIDYCDADDIPTSDAPSPKEWYTKPPKYTGNEKTPYLNEAAVEWVVTANCSPEGDPVGGVTQPTNVIVRVSHRGVAEVFNLYFRKKNGTGEDVDELIGTDCQVKMKCSADVSLKVDGVEAGKTNLSFEHTVNINMKITDEDGKYYKYGVSFEESSGSSEPSNSFTFPTVVKNNPGSKIAIEVSISNFKIENMVLSKGGDNIDCTTNLTSSSDGLISLNLTPPNDSSEKGKSLGFSVDDPRENLCQGQGAYLNWEYVESEEFDGASPDPAVYVGPTFGKVNANCKPGASGDRENFSTTAASPLLSTAFIRNTSMWSPLELGAIARGAKWETINLKAPKSGSAEHTAPEKYDPVVGIAQPGTTYDEGDAGILDQIKMTRNAYDCGKVNLNGRGGTDDDKEVYKTLLDALVSNVNVKGATAEQPAGESTQDNSGFAEEISKLPESVSIPTRASLLQQSTVASAIDNINSSGEGGNSDIEKEALFAKTVCLMTTRQALPDEILFVLVAQAITDVGDVEVSKVPDGKTDAVRMKTKEGRMDFDSNEKLYFDDIRSEVKMLFTVKYDPAARKFRIRQMEMVD